MDLTPYDPGLHVIQQAQEAHDAGDLARAKSLYLRGSEELMAVLQHDQEERRKSLVKKHVKNFMDKAEHIIDARRGAPPSRPPPPRPQSAPCPSSGSAAGGPALSDTARSLLASAQRSEKRARDAERELRFVAALPAFVEAAETFTALRAEVAGDSQLLSWAATRALAMIEGAERIKLLINNTSLGGDNSARSGAIITGADRNPIPAGGHRHGGGRKPQALAMQHAPATRPKPESTGEESQVETTQACGLVDRAALEFWDEFFPRQPQVLLKPFLAALAQRFRLEETQLTRISDKIDTDKDGKISQQVMVTVWGVGGGVWAWDTYTREREHTCFNEAAPPKHARWGAGWGV